MGRVNTTMKRILIVLIGIYFLLAAVADLPGLIQKMLSSQETMLVHAVGIMMIALTVLAGIIFFCSILSEFKRE